MSSDQNKTQLTKHLVEKFRESGYEVQVADGDANRLTIETAMNMSKTYKNCVIIGEDIDLLVILIALSPSDKEIFFLKPGRNKVP